MCGGLAVSRTSVKTVSAKWDEFFIDCCVQERSTHLGFFFVLFFPHRWREQRWETVSRQCGGVREAHRVISHTSSYSTLSHILCRSHTPSVFLSSVSRKRCCSHNVWGNLLQTLWLTLTRAPFFFSPPLPCQLINIPVWYCWFIMMRYHDNLSACFFFSFFFFFALQKSVQWRLWKTALKCCSCGWVI